MIDTVFYESPIGRLLLAADNGALIGLWMEGQKYYASSLSQKNDERSGPLSADDAASPGENMTVLAQTINWLDRYFQGERPDSRWMKLSPQGTPFRRLVWNLLLTIPYGHTVTYRDIAELAAKALGLRSMSAQAVGGAVAHNPISILIPCHRVLGCNGSLTGYAGGLEKKIYLLLHEGVRQDTFFTPETDLQK